MTKVRSVGVVSLAKVMGMSGLLIGALIGFAYGGIGILFGVLAAGSAAPQAGGMAALGVGTGVAAMVGIPLLYGALSFVAGALHALLLNLVLSLSGGLELELE